MSKMDCPAKNITKRKKREQAAFYMKDYIVTRRLQ